MQMRQSPRSSLLPMSNASQEKFTPGSLSLHQGVNVSFGENKTKEIGYDGKYLERGTINPIQEEGSPTCVGTRYGKNDEGESFKVTKIRGGSKRGDIDTS